MVEVAMDPTYRVVDMAHGEATAIGIEISWVTPDCVRLSASVLLCFELNAALTTTSLILFAQRLCPEVGWTDGKVLKIIDGWVEAGGLRLSSRGAPCSKGSHGLLCLINPEDAAKFIDTMLCEEPMLTIGVRFSRRFGTRLFHVDLGMTIDTAERFVRRMKSLACAPRAKN